jgi:hypothetical protein
MGVRGQKERLNATDIEDRENDKLHIIPIHDGKVTRDCAVCCNREVKRDRRET